MTILLIKETLVVNWDQYKQFYPDSSKIDIGHVGDPGMPVEIIQEQLGRVRGHLVQFPTEFLKDEDLQKGSIPFISDFTDELYT